MNLDFPLDIVDDFFGTTTFIIIPEETSEVNIYDIHLITDEEDFRKAIYYQLRAWTAAMISHIDHVVVRKEKNNDYEILVTYEWNVKGTDGENMKDETTFRLHAIRKGKEISM